MADRRTDGETVKKVTAAHMKRNVAPDNPGIVAILALTVWRVALRTFWPVLVAMLNTLTVLLYLRLRAPR